MHSRITPEWMGYALRVGVGAGCGGVQKCSVVPSMVQSVDEISDLSAKLWYETTVRQSPGVSHTMHATRTQIRSLSLLVRGRGKCSGKQGPA